MNRRNFIINSSILGIGIFTAPAALAKESVDPNIHKYPLTYAESYTRLERLVGVLNELPHMEAKSAVIKDAQGRFAIHFRAYDYSTVSTEFMNNIWRETLYLGNEHCISHPEFIASEKDKLFGHITAVRDIWIKGREYRHSSPLSMWMESRGRSEDLWTVCKKLKINKGY